MDGINFGSYSDMEEIVWMKYFVCYIFSRESRVSPGFIFLSCKTAGAERIYFSVDILACFHAVNFDTDFN